MYSRVAVVNHSLSIIVADTIESKSMVTRKLRRRAHCDPSSLSDGKRRKTATHSLVYLLDDMEVEDDVRTLCKVRLV